jgi:hypothetical protein
MQEKNKRLVMNGFTISGELSNTSFPASLLATRDSIKEVIFSKSKEAQKLSNYLEVNINNQLN